MSKPEPKRAKCSTRPPRVCLDCFWKRRYIQLERQFLALRLQILTQSKERRKEQLKKRGSGVLPPSQSLHEIEDMTDVEVMVDKLERTET